jgi:hypothetical protein
MCLLLLTGCTLDSFTLKYHQGDAGKDRVIAGSLDSVAVSTQGMLRDLGFTAVASQDGQVVRLTCTNSKGARFYVLLSRVENQGEERTHVQIKWEKNADDHLVFQLLTQLEAGSKH